MVVVFTIAEWVWYVYEGIWVLALLAAFTARWYRPHEEAVALLDSTFALGVYGTIILTPVIALLAVVG